MKKTLWISAMLFLILNSEKSEAQVHVDINIGRPPVYVAPAPVREVNYYYLPDEDVYYYVREKRYYYQDRGRWISSTRYRDCDPYRSRRVAIYESRPYHRHDYYRSKYKGNNKHSYHPGKGKGHKSRGRD
jgi:hypothetical protein